MAGLQPEKVGDVDEGAVSDVEVGGMTAEEQAQFDAMKAGRDIPAGDDAGGAADDAGAGDGEASDVDVDANAADGAGAGDGDAGAPDRDGAADGDAGAPRAPPKTISYGKYQREQKKQQDAYAALQAKLDGALGETRKEREERMRLDERTKMLLEAISTKQPAAAAPAADADPEPSKDDDPLGHNEWEIRQLKKTVSDLQSGRQRDVEQTAAQTEESQTMTGFIAGIEAEARTDPTIGEAFVHLRESRYAELGHIFANIDVNDPEQVKMLSPEDQMQLSNKIQTAFYNEQLLVAREARAKKWSPAKVVANLARARGYKPAAAAPAPKPNGNGAAAPANGRAVAAVAAPAKSVTEELGAIRDGLAASKSLSDAGGAPGDTLTPQRIADMTEDEFNDFYESMPKAKLDRLMGKVPQ